MIIRALVIPLEAFRRQVIATRTPSVLLHMRLLLILGIALLLIVIALELD